MASFFFLFFLCLFPSVFGSTQKRNITVSNPLTYPQTLISNNALFELGFFNPDNSNKFYLGIWYAKKDSNSPQVIWVANRNNPLNDSSSGVLRISSQNGNLELVNRKNQRFWKSSNVSIGSNSGVLVAQLNDSGNFVLFSDHASESSLWQSFEHPTNSLLPGMKLAVDHQNVQKQQLVAWNRQGDPSNGRFHLGINPRYPPELFVWDGDQPYWRAGPWNGISFIGIDSRPSVLLDRFNYVNDNRGEVSFTLLPPANQSILEHYVLNYDGTVVRNDWDPNAGKWVPVWKSLVSDCDVYGKCGKFGICNMNKSLRICDCLKGFEPKNEEEWNKGNWSSGCVRKKPLWCANDSANASGKTDRFIRLKNVKVPDGAEWVPSNGQDDCGKRCLGQCSCLAYTYYTGFGCMIWNRSLIDIQVRLIDIQVVFHADVDLFIRTSEQDNSNKLKIILPVVLITMAIFAFSILFCLWRWKRQQNGNRVSRADMPCHDDMSKPNPYPIEFKDLPLFKFDQLLVATNNFQESNKLGQGGFGPVYKGKLEDGQEIAVKRLARASGQGVEEFMNEVLLISKLQHRSLVRLLGCCVEREEKMLIYEYMPNKSLDALLFDPVHKESLDWEKRFNIIEGICRGLLYLHRDSRLKVIHRDLKASNVLLDEDLNPKISDFGMARIFGNKEDQANTLRVVGTLGYMAPEYAMEGRFSEKSDVFSFGVLLLEIISSRKVNSFENDGSLSLIGYAWKLWNEDDILSLVDQKISNPSIHCEIWKCIQIGLLCVQEFPEDRPNISDVISMLHCEISELPYPTQPGYVRRIISSHEDITGNGQISVNLVSLTRINGR